MIGRLSGTLLEKGTNSLVLDVNGVGYEVEVPLSTAFSLPESGQNITLHTHFVVREDAQLLYGFSRRDDRDMFRVLIRVNGVGPKLGITILSGLDSRSLARCVQDDDVSTLVKLPGIGKKTAERLLIELRDKVKVAEAEADDKGEVAEQSSPAATAHVQDEAESALIALGYKPTEAAKAIKRVWRDGIGVEEVLKLALKNML